ncbi:Pro-resilin-like 4 [Homarus americanus]|uniref:Pro-resilin-like 4 n=1 Tax=Homarus americanus TaxID=6706 RepID=A0A8J5TJ57_HOMAM|nr:Pro-resilin-like 4 [Homarus americanus]
MDKIPPVAKMHHWNHDSFHLKGMPFNFAYAVNDEYSGNIYSHNENSDGLVTNGQYTVLLPDGRTQVVTFTADNDLGYLAQVTYEGQATYTAPQPVTYN